MNPRARPGLCGPRGWGILPRPSRLGRGLRQAGGLVSGGMQLGPVVVMAFNRPDYLRETLASIAAQPCVAEGRREVHLFQDGAVNFHSGIR